MRRFAKGCGNVSLRLLLAAIPLVAAFATDISPVDSKLDSNRSSENNRRGAALVEQGKLVEAESTFRSALADCENCAALSSILNNLGEVYYATGRFAAAGPLYERALSLREKQEGTDAAALLPLLNSLALLYRETADYGRARRFAERARGIAESHNAAETVEGASAFSNLGAIEQMQGDLAGARKSLGRALSIREGLLAPSDPLIAETPHFHRHRFSQFT